MGDAASSKVLKVLKEVWGYDSLRPLQNRAIQASLEHKDALVVLPTGGGKSLCFQLPPLVDGGLTLVVSPLISLMTDQLQGLRLVGYPCAALHSGLDPAEADEAEEKIENGSIRLLYISPERLMTSGTQALLQRAHRGKGLRRIAIDEAHCISAWGHDFRPEYRELAKLRQLFPHAPIHALTATATPRVREDIIKQLALKNPEVLVGSFDRPNLHYRVEARTDAVKQTLDILKNHTKDAAIVYCISRKETETMAGALTALGIKASSYHAGLDSKKRNKISSDFAQEKVNVIVATVAFGMGIDRSNVRCVIHASLPKSIEGYQQETGRAGRDGIKSECVMLYSPVDIVRWGKVLSDGPAEVVRQNKNLLEEMRAFATSVSCRHKRLVEHFGQEYDGPLPCGACDACESVPEVSLDATKTAHRILATARDMSTGDFGFGAGHLVSILRGASTKQILQRDHDKLKGYGCLKQIPQPKVLAWVHQLLDQGLLGQSTGQFPTILFTEKAAETLRERAPVTLYDPRLITTQKEETADDPLFEKLREWRRQLSEERQVPAYVILNDATLKALAAARPTKEEYLLNVSGIGSQKAADFGSAVMTIVAQHCEENGLEPNTGNSAPPPSTEPKKESSAAFAYKALFDKGLTVEEVATQLGRAHSTVGGYLAEWIAEKQPASVSHLVSEDVIRAVAKAKETIGSAPLRDYFNHFGEKVPYSDIRVAMAYLRYASPPD